jgi:hypothetical protein
MQLGGPRRGYLLVIIEPRDEVEEAAARARLASLPQRRRRTSEAAVAAFRDIIAEFGYPLNAEQEWDLEEASHAYRCAGAFSALRPVKDPQTGRFTIGMEDLRAFVGLQTLPQNCSEAA